MAKAKPLASEEGGRPKKGENLDTVKVNHKGGNGTGYTLRRLARDAPEMLDRIESGELSVNAAAIQAGIRKKPTPEEVCLKAFRKAGHRLEVVKLIISELELHERLVIIELLRE